MKRNEPKKEKVNKDKQVLLLFDLPLLSRIDAQAKRNGLSRGALIRMLCLQYLERTESEGNLRFGQSTSGHLKVAETEAKYIVKTRT